MVGSTQYVLYFVTSDVPELLCNTLHPIVSNQFLWWPCVATMMHKAFVVASAVVLDIRSTSNHLDLPSMITKKDPEWTAVVYMQERSGHIQGLSEIIGALS